MPTRLFLKGGAGLVPIKRRNKNGHLVTKWVRLDSPEARHPEHKEVHSDELLANLPSSLRKKYTSTELSYIPENVLKDLPRIGKYLSEADIEKYIPGDVRMQLLVHDKVNSVDIEKAIESGDIDGLEHATKYARQLHPEAILRLLSVVLRKLDAIPSLGNKAYDAVVTYAKEHNIPPGPHYSYHWITAKPKNAEEKVAIDKAKELALDLRKIKLLEKTYGGLVKALGRSIAARAPYLLSKFNDMVASAEFERKALQAELPNLLSDAKREKILRNALSEVVKNAILPLVSLVGGAWEGDRYILTKTPATSAMVGFKTIVLRSSDNSKAHPNKLLFTIEPYVKSAFLGDDDGKYVDGDIARVEDPAKEAELGAVVQQQFEKVAGIPVTATVRVSKDNPFTVFVGVSVDHDRLPKVIKKSVIFVRSVAKDTPLVKSANTEKEPDKEQSKVVTRVLDEDNADWLRHLRKKRKKLIRKVKKGNRSRVLSKAKVEVRNWLATPSKPSAGTHKEQVVVHGKTKTFTQMREVANKVVSDSREDLAVIDTGVYTKFAIPKEEISFVKEAISDYYKAYQLACSVYKRTTEDANGTVPHYPLMRAADMYYRGIHAGVALEWPGTQQELDSTTASEFATEALPPIEMSIEQLEKSSQAIAGLAKRIADFVAGLRSVVDKDRADKAARNKPSLYTLQLDGSDAALMSRLYKTNTSFRQAFEQHEIAVFESAGVVSITGTSLSLRKLRLANFVSELVSDLVSANGATFGSSIMAAWVRKGSNSPGGSLLNAAMAEVGIVPSANVIAENTITSSAKSPTYKASRSFVCEQYSDVASLLQSNGSIRVWLKEAAEEKGYHPDDAVESLRRFVTQQYAVTKAVMEVVYPSGKPVYRGVRGNLASSIKGAIDSGKKVSISTRTLESWTPSVTVANGFADSSDVVLKATIDTGQLFASGLTNKQLLSYGEDEDLVLFRDGKLLVNSMDDVIVKGYVPTEDSLIGTRSQRQLVKGRRPTSGWFSTSSDGTVYPITKAEALSNLGEASRASGFLSESVGTVRVFTKTRG